MTSIQSGFSDELVSDPDRVWYPQRAIDYAQMELESAKRRYAQIHEDKPFHDGRFRVWAAEATEATPYHFLDGVRIYVAETDINPDDDFLTPPERRLLSQPTTDAE